jgi:ATP-binding cassette subfamily B protein
VNADDRQMRRNGWRVIAGALRPRWRTLLMGVVASFVWVSAKLAVPLLAAAAIDQGIVPGDGQEIVKYSLLMALAGMVQGFGTGLRRYTAFKLGYRIEGDLRERLFAHLQRLHFAFHDEAQTGELMSRANTDLLQITQLLFALPMTLSSILIFIGVAIVMVAASPTLALLALGTLPLLTILAARYSRRMGPVSVDLQGRLGDLAGVVEESVAGVRAVKGFGAEGLQIGRLQTEAESVRTQAIAAAKLRAWFLPFVDFFPALALIAILWYGGHQVIDGDLEIGQLIAFNSYILMLIFPLRLAGIQVAQASRASVSGGRVHEVLVTEPTVVDPAHPRTLPVEGRGELRFEGVRFGYNPDAPVLDGLDLVLHPGEAVAVVGPTASGKTTTASLIPRFYDVDAGAVLLDGVDVRELALHELRNAVGLVFEDTFLFTDSIRDNIAFAEPDAPIDQVQRAARLSGAADFIDALPDGYDTLIGEHGYSLSGGQRQRIAIARAVLADPRILILDDATSSVDPTKEHEIRAALGEVMAGRTTLIIAHRPATIALADRVVVLDHGRVRAEGTHEQLLATSPLYRELLAQAEHAASDPEAGGTDGGAPDDSLRVGGGDA